MKYLALSYHLFEEMPQRDKEGYAILICAPPNAGSLASAFKHHDDLSIRNLLIMERIICREDFMSRIGAGTYEDSGDDLEKVIQNLAEKHRGINPKNKGYFCTLVLKPEEAKRYHQERD